MKMKRGGKKIILSKMERKEVEEKYENLRFFSLAQRSYLYVDYSRLFTVGYKKKKSKW